MLASVAPFMPTTPTRSILLVTTQEPRAPEVAGASAAPSSEPWWQRVHARNRAMSPVQAGTMRGAVWAVFVATEFYLFSNPLVFIPWFEFSLDTGVEYAVFFFLLQAPWLRWRLPPLTVVLFLAFATLGLTWSQQADVTLINLEIYLAIAVIAWIIASNISTRVFSHALLLGGVLVVALSLYALHENLPGAGIAEGSEGFMAGVGTNRNILAYVLAPVCASIAMPPRTRRGWVLWGPAVAFVLAGLWLADSATGDISTLAALATVGILFAGEWSRHHLDRRRRSAAWIGGLALGGLLVWRMGEVAAFFGRDASTFSGRVPIWKAAWEATQPQLWQGFGWGSVWPHPWVPAPPNHVMDVIWFATNDPNYYPPHGHSSLFDLLPEVGLIGVALAALMHLEVAGRAVMLRRSPVATQEDVRAGRLVIVLLVVVLVFGISEPLTTIPFGWFLLVIACGILPIRRRDRLLHQRPGRRRSTKRRIK